jgi:hypothetical protein
MDLRGFSCESVNWRNHIHWVAAQLVAFQEGHSYVKLVGRSVSQSVSPYLSYP